MTTWMKPALILALLLVVPTVARAQEMNYDTAVRAYYAAEQMNREVWWNNPNPAEAIRHAMLIGEQWGLGPGTNPYWIDPSDAPRAEGWRAPGCLWLQDEAGNWIQWCSEIHTYGACYGTNQINDMRTLQQGAFWFGWFYGAAAIYAGGVPGGQVAVPVFGGAALIFSGLERLMEYRIQEMERQRCV